MAFDIKLQQNESEPERVIKKINDIMTVTGELKSETSIIDPSIMIECDLSLITSCNYMSIPIFKRSYFIRDIRSIRNGLVEFTCHVDVLSSFAEQIKTNAAIIKRQENKWNLYLNDGTFKIYQNPHILTRPFPSGFSGAREFVLAVAGG